MTAFDDHTLDRSSSPSGALAAALDRGAYEEVAIRLLLGVVRGIEVVGDLAPDAREELLSLLALDGDDAPTHRGAR